ncbi:hypothetical protein CONPUDRAFT_151832 [Coniophora puteana RWD-64-598 SS2]|uniref:BTB domain-containing protein n=1 Tax=Coniophora puteana (strain RWD-64-598) TaxID=741705 RepID=A0A5M3MUB9_CONPW|nr:uncharacterized protein CONPUDRAFT_151832 [Coniophora puteana RWD-64-598 SS2]EIW82772.1 hypothetical protein CONPUDRAFT_151832 [Coniophora puteana RWD-64-598 SS2]
MASMRAETTEALERSLSSGPFINTRFNVFSSRRKVGGGQRLCHPLPLYAASATLNRLELENSNYGDVSNIKRMTLCDIISARITERAFFDVDDEYEEDSDFDGDEGSLIEEEAEESCSASKADCSDAPTSAKSSGISKNTYDDIVSGCIPATPSTFVVTGFAYRTWKAFLFYAYTGQVNFSPLTSNPHKYDEKTDDHGSGHNDIKTRCPPCSPKSMYRLADKIQIGPLKKLAFEEICKNLNKDNILQEVLSKFTAAHPEIREVETRVLMGCRRESGVMDAFPKKIAQMMRGEIPHCEEVLATVMMTLWNTS